MLALWGGNPQVLELVWEGTICGRLVFVFLGGVRVLILPVLLAPQPKASPPPSAKGTKELGEGSAGHRKTPWAAGQAAWLPGLVLLLICCDLG